MFEHRISVRSIPLSGLVFGMLAMAASSPAISADPPKATGSVSQEQFKQSLQIMRRMMNRIDTLEKKSGGSGGGVKDGEVDLSQLGSEGGSSHSTSRGGPRSSGVAPNWKAYFDLNLVNRPGTSSDLTFANYHAFLFYEILPNDQLQFAFDVSTSPRFYELDWQATPKLQVRAGKIWIPLDDMAPHSIFGGRVNVSRINVGTDRFLPDTWSELGVGIKYQLIDTAALGLVGQLYVTNGFKSGGTDPYTSGNEYPAFSDSTVTDLDNNRNKAIGARLAANLSGVVSVGGSHYRARWNDQSKTLAQDLAITGLDAQFRVKSTEVRAGIALMNVGIPADNMGRTSYKRGGTYGELGHRFGKDQKWKGLLRAGTLNTDDRVVDTNDQQIVGGTLLWRPSLVELSVEHSRDLKKIPSKSNYTYSALRVIIAL